MAQPHPSRDQEAWQEEQRVQELLTEWQAIEERRQRTVRLHMRMHQRSHLEIPVQYERLFLHAPTRKEEKKYDHRRGTQQSHRRRVSPLRV
jgi:hypothetical protein